MFCTHCGKKNPEEANYCLGCGNQMARPEAAPPDAPIPAEPEAHARTPRPRIEGTHPEAPSAGYVAYTNPQTGEVKTVKVGWSWTCFLFSGFFGVPLFVRGLTNWGLVMVAMVLLHWVTSLAAATQGEDLDPGLTLLVLLPWAASLWLSIYLGVRGNEITARRYRHEGWVFANRESDVTHPVGAAPGPLDPATSHLELPRQDDAQPRSASSRSARESEPVASTESPTAEEAWSPSPHYAWLFVWALFGVIMLIGILGVLALSQQSAHDTAIAAEEHSRAVARQEASRAHAQREEAKRKRECADARARQRREEQSAHERVEALTQRGGRYSLEANDAEFERLLSSLDRREPEECSRRLVWTPP